MNAEEDAQIYAAELARQLTDACRRRADAWREGYDAAMSDAHSTLNQMGYLERRSRPNPYAPSQMTGDPVDPWEDA